MVVMDQELHAKACEDTWKQKYLYAEVLSQARNFSYSFQPSIHNWQTVPRRWFARYLDESGIIAEGSVSSVLEGDVQSCGSSSQVHLRGPTAGHQFIAWETNNYPKQADAPTRNPL